MPARRRRSRANHRAERDRGPGAASVGCSLRGRGAGGAPRPRASGLHCRCLRCQAEPAAGSGSRCRRGDRRAGDLGWLGAHRSRRAPRRARRLTEETRTGSGASHPQGRAVPGHGRLGAGAYSCLTTKGGPRESPAGRFGAATRRPSLRQRVRPSLTERARSPSRAHSRRPPPSRARRGSAAGRRTP